MPSGYIRVPSGFLFRLRCSPAPPAPLPRFRVPPLRVPFAVRRDGDADVRLPRDRDVRETSPSDIWQQHLARTCSGKYVAPRTGGRGGGREEGSRRADEARKQQGEIRGFCWNRARDDIRLLQRGDERAHERGDLKAHCRLTAILLYIMSGEIDCRRQMWIVWRARPAIKRNNVSPGNPFALAIMRPRRL